MNELRMRERSVVRLSVTPSTKCSCSGSPPIFENGRTTIEAALDHLGPVVSLYGRVALRMRKATLGDLMIDADILAPATEARAKAGHQDRRQLSGLAHGANAEA
jgi:hypothetical protein